MVIPDNHCYSSTISVRMYYASLIDLLLLNSSDYSDLAPLAHDHMHEEVKQYN